MRGFQLKKAVQALNYFAQKGGGVLNKMKAVKLIWLADRYHIRQYGRTITGDVYFAMQYGPVPSATRDILQANSLALGDAELQYSRQFLAVSEKEYSSCQAPELKVFSDTDMWAMDLIFNKYGSLGPFELSGISHQFPEWKEYESALKAKIGYRFEMDFTDFFKIYDDGTSVFVDEEENLAISKDFFLESHSLPNRY